MIEETLIQHNKVYIVGAQSRAKTLTGYLSFLYPHVSVAAYLVDELSQNDVFIQEVPVYKLEKSALLHIEFPVFIATKGISHVAIQETLHQLGFQTVFPVTVDVDNFLRNAYVRKYYAQEHRSFTKIVDLPVKQPEGAVYMAKSVCDKPLQTEYACPDYEKAIQVGAALTTKRLSSNILTDCEGENISVKNRQYCELTALYWIWKHAKEDIVGLSHYRRHFVLPDEWQEIMHTNEIDVILPVPTFVYPNIEENYKERHDPADWEFLMKYLEENSPNDYKAARKVFSESLYSPCNMLITHKKILDVLCSWMFPILDAVAKHGGVKEDAYMNRYPGFISERLITLFFYKNGSRYKIAYADKNFIT